MNKKGLITLEACLLIILCVAAGIGMSVYLRRSIQGNWRMNTDTFSEEQYDVNQNTQAQAPAVVLRGLKITTDITGDSNNLLNQDSGIKQIDGWGAAK